MSKVFISTTSFGQYDESPVARLVQAGLEVQLNPYKRTLAPEECLLHYRDAVGLIAGTEQITREILESSPQMKVISRCGTGIDNIDHEAAKELGIRIFNTPDGPTLAVAELTVGLVLSLLRKIAEMDRDIRAGTWKKQMGNLVSGKRIGIIGYGRIGRKVGDLLEALGGSIYFYDPAVRDSQGNARASTFKDILGKSDIVCVHVSGSPGNKSLIGERELQSMQQGTWLVNCSRGGVVDENALYECLSSGHLSGAAIDVFEQEPYHGRLAGLANVIVTPHIGSYAKEARAAMELQAVDNLLRGLEEAR